MTVAESQRRGRQLKYAGDQAMGAGRFSQAAALYLQAAPWVTPLEQTDLMEQAAWATFHAAMRCVEPLRLN